jgi:hypothetical protein
MRAAAMRMKKIREHFNSSNIYIIKTATKTKSFRRLAANCSKLGEPLLQYNKNDFKNLKSVGVPKFGPNLAFKAIISSTFFVRMSL